MDAEQILQKELNFQFERDCQKIFDKIYKKNNWKAERIYGIANKDYDVKLTFGGRDWAVEEKYRRQDYGDLLVEITQDTETLALGWIYTTKAELLFYGAGNKVYFVWMDKLREFVEQNTDRFPTKVSNMGWGRSINIAIPWDVIIDKCIGNLI